MEWRYLAAGANVAAFSLALFVIGYLTDTTMLEGIAASGLIVGIVLLVLGFTYTEPAERLYDFFSTSLGGLVERIAEDTGLLESGTLSACPREESVIVVLHREPQPVCSEYVPGLLVSSNGYPYIAIRVPSDYVYEEGYARFEDLLRYLAVTRYGIARDVGVQFIEKGVRITLVGIPASLERYLGRVADPVKTLIVAATAYAAENPVTLEEWRGAGGNYVFQLRLHRVAAPRPVVLEAEAQ